MHTISIYFSDGCYRLAQFLEGIRPDLEKARKVHKLTCREHKTADSCYRLGILHFLGRGGPVNKEKAIKYFDEGCVLGSGVACFNMAKYHLEPKTEESTRKAIECFKKACDADDATSCALLSGFYYQGTHGVEKSLEETFKYTKRACQLGNIQACGNLSALYKNGQGVEKDVVMAKRYRDIAKEMKKQEEENQIKFG